MLFLVEPLVSKLILPWFGGSAAVWLTCMLFFQASLLVGYAYAHLLTRRLPISAQVIVHCSLLVLSFAYLPIAPSAGWEPLPGQDPALRVLAVLTMTIGLPFTLLSATSPLLQIWYSKSNDAALPYRYFALSNAGSLLALLSYPILIEPRFTNSDQARTWSAGYVIFTMLCVTTALISRTRWREETAQDSHLDPRRVPITRSRKLLWVVLAACPSALLLGVTSLLTVNIAPMPLLWVLPLSVYLFTFILCFESDRWYKRRLFLMLVLPALGCLATGSGPLRNRPMELVLSLLLSALFICCMTFHGELARLKPDPSELTAFYLSLAVGGACGGLFVALLAPRFFNAMYEYPLTLVACAALLLALVWRDRSSSIRNNLAWSAGAAGTIILAGYVIFNAWSDSKAAVFLGRNFYGTLRVDDLRDVFGKRFRQLNHGIITHGAQYLEPGIRGRPITYYARNSGVGLTWRVLERAGSIRAGIVGLGSGTLAAYGRAGDVLEFYEINPLVVEIAKKQFSYLSDCPAHIDVFLGDARLTMARQLRQGFDLLVLDAFSGDAIPLHLLTREAFQIYFLHLKPDGVLALHISNRYLDLAPVAALAARQAGKHVSQIESDSDDPQQIYGSTYVLVTSRAHFFEDALFKGQLETIPVDSRVRPWTDNFSNLYQELRFREE